MLTIEEKAKFESQCTEARFHCGKVYDIIAERKKELTALYKFHNKWHEKFKIADRKLAMDNRRQVLPSPGERKERVDTTTTLITNLDKAEILKVIERLQQELGKEGKR